MRHNEALKTDKTTSHQKSDREPVAATAEVEPIETAVPVESIDLPAAAQADVDRLQTERDQLFDRLARLQAEFDNYRKR